jgi:hypothetical protein
MSAATTAIRNTALVGMLLCTSTAVAQNDDDALIHHGVELRKQGHNAEALAEFQRADEAHPNPRAKAQIALAEQALGRWVEAEAGLLAVLAASDPWIAHNRQPLEDALATIRDHLGTLEVESNVDGATIIVNGAAAGTSPLQNALRVVAGSAQIEVRAEGYDAMTRAIDVPPRSAVKAAIVIAPLASASATPPIPAAAIAPAAVPAPTATARDARTLQANATPWTQRAGTITLIAAVPLLATGVIAHVVRENNVSTYNDDARCFKAGQTRDQRCGGMRDTADTATVVAAIGYAAGAAALITGVTLLLSGKHGGATEDGPRVSALLDQHTAYLACGATF